MKKQKTKICPRCEKEYTNFPALSRRDSKTDICSDCGQEEALLDFVLFRKSVQEKSDFNKMIAKEVSFMVKLIRKTK